MRFALLGNHPVGLAMAGALVQTGRHELAAYTTLAATEQVRSFSPAVLLVADLEEVLADPAIEALIVAGSAANRPVQLRRSLQSERHVLCVYPADQSPDIAYEAALIQRDTHKVLLPLMPEALHPGIARLAALCRAKEGPLGTFRLIEMEQASPGEVLINAEVAGYKPSLPGWQVLRVVGGEIAEISGFAAQEEVEPGQPVLLAGRFEQGGLFQVSLLPYQHQPRWRLAAVGSGGRAELVFPLGWPGPAFLSWHDETGELHEEAWDMHDPWPLLVDAFESAVATEPQATPTWQDAIRCLELDDAARRSVERRRASTLEYPEASEEVGFKGTMTLIGCGLLWAILFVLILSFWYPRLRWAIVAGLVLFLALQVLRWVVPNEREPGVRRPPRGENREQHVSS
jgi:predicted dehydrogenase